ncbi:uncharacterized protein [Palaemon carinicauda]|uniref:uncharacterized protein n=1 Tax=Palaemon carinicauda TaxID=392227 RepID=UPI0035B668A3
MCCVKSPPPIGRGSKADISDYSPLSDSHRKPRQVIMDATRSAQDESDEDNNSASPLSDRNGAAAGGGGTRDPNESTSKPQRKKKIYIHRCPFSHDCSSHCKDRKSASDLPPNVPTDSSQMLYTRDSRKIQNLCQQAASDSVDYSRFLKNVQNVGPLPNVEGDSVFMPVFNPEQRLVFLQRGINRASESPFRRTYSTQSYPPYIGMQPFRYYPQEADSLAASPSPPLPSPWPYSAAHRTFPEENKPQCSSRLLPSGVPTTSPISKIRDTANLLASLGPPEDLSHLPYPSSSPLPATPSCPGAATSELNSEGVSHGSPPGCQVDAITPLFRQYCRHFL